jgi:Undecaprenyl-phosphate glucose phosphotransferase
MSLEAHLPDKAEQLDRSVERAGFSTEAVPYILSTADALIILLSSVVGDVSYQMAAGYGMPDFLSLSTVALISSFIYIVRMSGRGYYDLAESAKPRVEITEILFCWFTTGLLLAFFAFILKVGVDYSRGGLGTFYLVGAVGLLGLRKATKKIIGDGLTKGAVVRRDLVLIGDPRELTSLEPRDYLTYFGCPAVHRFALSDGRDPSRERADLQIIETVAAHARQHECRQVVLALPWADVERIEFIRNHVKRLPVSVQLLPDIRVRSLTNYTSSARQRVLAIEIQRAPLSSAERFIKRVMDVFGAGLALILFLPIITFTAIAIKLDSRGPVIFRQSRKGFSGRQFVMYKFRTMTVQENGATVVQASRNDKRVTAIGRLLRSTSIDELPQLLNVLKGDMSLIGPRPHALAHDNEFEKLLVDYAFRHHVKPGMTGWAQCNGARGATPSLEHISQRVQYDLWYINNWSLWLDIQIIIKTVFEVLRRRNAY